VYSFVLHRPKGVQDKHFEQGYNPASWARHPYNVIKRFEINQINSPDNEMITDYTAD